MDRYIEDRSIDYVDRYIKDRWIDILKIDR